MSVTCYHRKPDPRPEGRLHVARYEPGQPLDDLLAVAAMADRRAEAGEVEWPSGKVLVVKWVDRSRDYPSEPEFEVVRAGCYLAYSEGYGNLVETDDDELRQFYEADGEPGPR